MGPGRALSETRDTTDRIFPLMFAAVTDTIPEVKYWGRKMVLLLSQHRDFARLSERHLGPADAKYLLDETVKIRSKGVGLNYIKLFLKTKYKFKFKTKVVK